MADFNKSGSNSKKGSLSISNNANPENSNGPRQNKDSASRGRKNNCWHEMKKMICKIMEDDSIMTTWTWDERKEKVEEANERLEDPQFILRWLRKLIETSMMGHLRVENALQEVESFLKSSKNPVSNQGYINEINGIDKEVQVKKEELQFLKEQLMQENAIGDRKKQLVMDARTFFIVSRMLSKVGSSCFVTMSDIMNHTNPVQGHLVQKEDEKLILNFHPAPDSTQINQNGKNDEILNSEMIDQEEPVEEVNLTLAFVGERLEKLTLEMPKSDQMNDASWYIVNLEDLDNLLNDVPDPSEGTSNATANEADMNLSFYESSEVSSMVQRYNVYKGNVNVLTEIFQKHPHIDKEFQVKHLHFQSVCMNTLAELYRSLESNLKIFELVDITHMEVMVKDMELTGLELSWLKHMLAKAREMLEDQVEEKRLQEDIDSSEAMAKEATLKANKAKEKLAELKKKRRRE